MGGTAAPGQVTSPLQLAEASAKSLFPAEFTNLAQPVRLASPILPAQESSSLPFRGEANNHQVPKPGTPTRVVGRYDTNSHTIKKFYVAKNIDVARRLHFVRRLLGASSGTV